MDSADNTERLIDGLADRGWAILPDFFAPSLMTELLDEVTPQSLSPAGTGRQSEHRLGADIRTDSTLWLNGASAAQSRYLAAMEAVRVALNRGLFMGLFDYECHYALYKEGGFYRKHLDSLHGSRNRLVSCVTYLTPGWQEADKGHLVLYDPKDDQREIARALPHQGTLAMFLSEDIPHEVLPPKRPRASIAGWFRCNQSTGDRVDPAR